MDGGPSTEVISSANECQVFLAIVECNDNSLKLHILGIINNICEPMVGIMNKFKPANGKNMVKKKAK